MRNLLNCLAALAAVPMLAGPVLANPCVRCRAVAVKKVAVKVKREVIVKKEVATIAVPFFVPAYVAQVLPAPNVTYNITTPPPPAQPVQQITAATYVTPPAIGIGIAAPQAVAAPAVQNDRLAMILERLDKRLCRLEENAGIANGNEAVKADAGIPKVLVSKCAVCHNATSATNDGGGFVLFDKGSLAPLSERQIRLIGSKTYSGAMPPKNNKHGVVPLTDQEVADVQAWIAGQK